MFENELCILEKYKLTPTELFTVKCILISKEEGDNEPLRRLSSILEGGLRLVLEKLQTKGIILKSWKLPKIGERLEVADIPFNQNFQKQYFRASYEMGIELFETYPQFITISGVNYNARRISKKFNDLEEAYAKYGKAIKYNDELHQQILDDIRYGIEHGYNFTTLDDFIADRAWTALHAYRIGEGTNVNVEAIKMI